MANLPAQACSETQALFSAGPTHLAETSWVRSPRPFAVLSLEAVVGASFCVALLAAAPAWAPAFFCRWSVSVRADNLDDVHARVVATNTKNKA